MRPAHAYSEDNTTTFSDPSYQQQSFPQNDYVSAYDMVPFRQGEEGLWSDHSTALLPVDGLAGVGQAQYLADAFAGRTGSLDADALLGAYGGPRRTAMECASMGLVSLFPLRPNRSVSNHGELRSSSTQSNYSSGLTKAQSNDSERKLSVIPLRSPVETSDGEGFFRCTMCHKPKRRRCELKYNSTHTLRREYH